MANNYFIPLVGGGQQMPASAEAVAADIARLDAALGDLAEDVGVLENLDAGDIPYDDSETYDANTVGAGLNDLKIAIAYRDGIDDAIINGGQASYPLIFSEAGYIGNAGDGAQQGQLIPYSGWYATDFIRVLSASIGTSTDATSGKGYNAFYAADFTFIENFTVGGDVSVPTNAVYFRMSKRIAETVTAKMVVSDSIASLKSFDDNLTTVFGGEVRQSFEWINNSYVTESGVITAYNGWHRTDYIEVNPRETVHLYATSGSSTQTYNCWYDANKQFISNFLVNNTITEYTAPADAKYFILSTNVSNDVVQGIRGISIESARANLGVVAKKTQAFTFRGNLAASSSKDTGLGFAVKTGFKAGLYGEFSGSFGGLTFQFDAYSPNQIIVDDTNVTLKVRFASDVVLPHGITVSDNIQVNIIADDPASIKVTVASNGTQNTVTGAFVISAYESFKLINGSSAMYNVVFTMGCGSINHNVWLFGDSYFGMTNPARWPYYINQNGYMKNTLFCGSTGSGATEGNLWLPSLLSLGTPKTIVWCMGMNYPPDSSSAPAASWVSQVRNLMSTCEANGIELVLATIPTVPTINHEQKNAFVRASGYRYIDFAKAVGADSNGHWIGYGTDKDMLSSDGVHPSVYGAIALYNAAIAAVPELTYDYD